VVEYVFMTSIFNSVDGKNVSENVGTAWIMVFIMTSWTNYGR
jgi:hypothetical protein